jgi:hypothetical protein
MSGAINGEENGNDAYIFTIIATIKEVESYYASELSKLGWTLLATGSGGTGGNTLMIFTGSSGTLTVSILVADEEASLMYVMILET